MKIFLAFIAWAVFCLLALAPPIQAHTAAQCKCQCEDSHVEAARRMAERDQERAALHLPPARQETKRTPRPDRDDD